MCRKWSQTGGIVDAALSPVNGIPVDDDADDSAVARKGVENLVASQRLLLTSLVEIQSIVKSIRRHQVRPRTLARVLLV